jgi:cellulose synthase/poly-beta-1,6-N-acetylglucosamine synthase-like glycosyltransferase
MAIRPNANSFRSLLGALAALCAVTVLAGSLFMILTAGDASAATATASSEHAILPPAPPVQGVITANSVAAPNPSSPSTTAAKAGVGSPGPWALLGYVLLLLFTGVLTATSGSALWWMVRAWRTPESLEESSFGRATTEHRSSFSLIVPARHEEQVLETTLEHLASMNYPKFEVLVVVGHDDPGTAAVAESCARRHPDNFRVLVDHHEVKNKPKALNLALAACTGDVVGVFDAEDIVHPDLLNRINARFDSTGADIVQGGVQLMNVGTNWFSARNVLEYYFYFRSRLHYFAQRRFIPLGGNTIFIRTHLLIEAHGWDEECLAEDCEIGVRLSSDGAVATVAYDPEVVTREETPATYGAFLKQRTRWNQGFLQVLRKGEWRALPGRGQRLLARYTLLMPFLQALTAVAVPVSVVLVIVAKVPETIAMISFVPAILLLVTLSVELAGLSDVCAVYQLKARTRDYLRVAFGTLPFQWTLAVAAVRAVLRELRGNRGWEKTEHVGNHTIQDHVGFDLDLDVDLEAGDRIEVPA